MMKLGEIDGLKNRKKSKRYGLGFSAGSKTCGRGQKGQLSRSGKSRPYVGFEGGQTPHFRRVPKRGFRSPNRVEYVPINVSVLNSFEEGEVVSPEALVERGLVRRQNRTGIALFKVLGNGELEKKLVVKAHAFSQAAEAKIKGAGGSIEVVGA
jgi:large subunit ribosomal protein L15